MTRRLWLAIAMLAIGASLLVAASFAGAASGKSPQSSSMGKKTGGTLVVDSDSDVDYTDPQLDYLSTGWQIQYVTQVKLFNFADKNGAAGTQLQPEGAAGQPLVSKDGKTYTFKVKPGFVFSDGKPVTAANYAYAINRGLNPKMSSPAAQFMTDIVVGAQAVVDGKAATASGVIAKGNTLTIKLLKPAPDLIARLSMAFFSAIPLNLPIDPNGVDVYASAGPYYIASRTPNRQIVIKRNPHYKGNRPHNFDQIVFSVGNSLPTIRLAGDNRRDCGTSRLSSNGMADDQSRHVATSPDSDFTLSIDEALEAAARGQLPGVEPRPAALQEERAAREGDQLRSRSARDHGPGGYARRQAD